MDSPASSNRKRWRIGVPQMCGTCKQLRDFDDFHEAGRGAAGTRRAECKFCRNPKMAKYAYDKVWAKGPCYFCDKPIVYLSYCADHWHQYRHEHLESLPEFQMMRKYVGYVANYFNISSTLILYTPSRKAPIVHIRMVAMLVIRHLTNAQCEKLAMLFSRNISNVVRTLQKAQKFYIQYPEFAEDVDGVLALMRKDGIIQ